MNDQQAAQRGRDAKDLLAHPLLIEAWASYRERLHAVMETAKSDEATLRAKMLLGMLGDLRAHFESIVEEGELAAEAIKLEEEEEEAKRKPWWRAA